MNRAGWLTALTLLWLFTWIHSARAWLELEQYRYGWAIPPLALFVAYRRWQGSIAVGQNRVVPLLACGLGIAIFARGVFLTWLDPSWRMTGAFLTLGAAACTAGWFYLEGGQPLLRRQVFTLCFCFLALPWPTFLESYVTVTLLKTITSGVVVFLNLCGIAAAQVGNVIQLHLHEVGMETACSGIESLQAALMAAVFLGELHLLSRLRRLMLVGAAILLAMGMNFARVSVLACLVEFRGPAVAARLHDMAGGAATTILFLLLVFASRFGARKPRTVRASAISSITPAPAWAGWCCATAICCIIAVGALTFHSSLAAGDRTSVLWNLDASRLPPGWTAHRDSLTAVEQAQKHHGEEERWRITSPHAGEAYVIYLHWKNGMQSQATAYPHSPGLCLRSQGWTPEGRVENVRIKAGIGQESFPFTSYRFSQQAARLIALQCLSGGQAYLPDPTAERPNVSQRIVAQLYRRPRYVSEDLLIYLPESGDNGRTIRMVTELVKAFHVTR